MGGVVSTRRATGLRTPATVHYRTCDTRSFNCLTSCSNFVHAWSRSRMSRWYSLATQARGVSAARHPAPTATTVRTHCIMVACCSSFMSICCRNSARSLRARASSRCSSDASWLGPVTLDTACGGAGAPSIAASALLASRGGPRPDWTCAGTGGGGTATTAAAPTSCLAAPVPCASPRAPGAAPALVSELVVSGAA